MGLEPEPNLQIPRPITQHLRPAIRYFFPTIERRFRNPIIAALRFWGSSREWKGKICAPDPDSRAMRDRSSMARDHRIPVQRHAASAGRLRPRDGQNTRTDSLPDFSLRNALASRARRNVAGRRLRSRFHPRKTRSHRSSTAVVVHGTATSCRSDFRQLYLTAVPAGGSRTQQALHAIQRQSRVPRRLHHRGTSQRRVADGEQRQRQSSFRQPTKRG